MKVALDKAWARRKLRYHYADRLRNTLATGMGPLTKRCAEARDIERSADYQFILEVRRVCGNVRVDVEHYTDSALNVYTVAGVMVFLP